jgi:hypothetical protein
MRTFKISHAFVLASLVTLIALLMGAPLTSAQNAPPTATPLFGDTFGLPTPTFGPTPIPISLTGVNGRAERAPVAIRSGPGVQFPRIGRVSQGRSIDIIGWNGWQAGRECGVTLEDDLDMWVQVQFGARAGWIARCVLTITGRLTDLPLITASGERLLQR